MLGLGPVAGAAHCYGLRYSVLDVLTAVGPFGIPVVISQ
jgi:hypothetical protein